jgi:hypothetical protein
MIDFPSCFILAVPLLFAVNQPIQHEPCAGQNCNQEYDFQDVKETVIRIGVLGVSWSLVVHYHAIKEGFDKPGFPIEAFRNDEKVAARTRLFLALPSYFCFAF